MWNENLYMQSTNLRKTSQKMVLDIAIITLCTLKFKNYFLFLTKKKKLWPNATQIFCH